MKNNIIKRILTMLIAATMLASLFVVPSYAETSVPDPMAWYTFANESNLGEDKMGRYELCEWRGTLKSGDGAVGKGLVLDGQSCLWIRSDNDDIASALGTSFTLSYYAARGTREGEWMIPVALDKFYALPRIDGAGGEYLHADIARDWWTHVTNVAQNTFTTLVLYTFSVSDKVVNVYMNDVLVNTFTLDNTIDFKADDRTFTIGSESNGAGWYNAGVSFNGTIDEVRVWNTALNADQVSAVYNSDQSRTEDTAKATLKAPIAAYTFEDSENPGKDITGNGNHLTKNEWEGGAVKTENGKLALDGKSILHALPDANGKDFTDGLKSFTYTIKASLTEAPADNVVILSSGFSWEAFAGGASLVLCADPNWFAIDICSNINWRGSVFTSMLGENWNATEHRYTVAYDDTDKTLKLWVDDAIVYSASNVTGVNMNVENAIFAIGALNEYVEGEKNWCGYTGKMLADDVAVFDYALTGEQVRNLDSVFVEKNSDVDSDDTNSGDDNADTSDMLSVNIVATVMLALTCGAIAVSKKRR